MEKLNEFIQKENVRMLLSTMTISQKEKLFHKALKEMQVLRQENEGFKNSINRFNEDIEIKDGHIKRLGQSNRDYIKAFEDLEKENRTLKNTINRLNDELDIYFGRL